MDATSVIITLVVLAVIVAAIAVGARAAADRRSRRLQDTFGPEYDRALAGAGGERSQAEAELQARQERRRHLDIRPLDEAARARHQTSWEQVQIRFVDMPQQALAEADALISRILSDRGYPMDGFDRQMADVSVDHPAAVESYRYAHDMLGRARRQDATTEEMRLAMQRYRTLADELLAPAASTSEQLPNTRRPELG